MSRTLTIPEVLTVRQMLLAGVRQVEVARELNLSVWTVSRIAVDWQLQSDDLTAVALPEDDAPADYAAERLRRCPGCGAMVYHWPCLACVMFVSPRLPAAEEVADDAEEVDELGELLEEVARS